MVLHKDIHISTHTYPSPDNVIPYFSHCPSSLPFQRMFTSRVRFAWWMEMETFRYGAHVLFVFMICFKGPNKQNATQ